MKWITTTSCLLSHALLWGLISHASLCGSFLLCQPSAACTTVDFAHRHTMELQMLDACRPREPSQVHASMRISAVLDNAWSSSNGDQAEATDVDIQKLAFILANVTDHLESSPAVALSILSQEMGWLYSRNVPK